MTGTAVASCFNYSSYASYQTSSKKTGEVLFSDSIDVTSDKVKKQEPQRGSVMEEYYAKKPQYNERAKERVEGGYVVLKCAGISAEDMLDLYDIRLHLEGEAARRAAVNITDEQLGELLELTELQRFYINKQGNSSSEHTKNLDSQFHEVLYAASGSKSYTEVLVRLHKKMSKFRMASVSKQSRALQSNDEHMEICRAMALHDPDAAEDAVLKHVRNAMDRMEHLELKET